MNKYRKLILGGILLVVFLMLPACCNLQYKFHVKHFGHPSEIGYKDIVAMWKAENFDPARLMKLYKAAGAKYFVTIGVHHDNFDCWNSKYHKWNSVLVGPHKDIVGLWREAALKEGLRFGVTEHLERAYSWFNTNKGADKSGPKAGVPYDGNDPKYADFYFPPHEDTTATYPKNPPEWWQKQWHDRIQDLIDSYQPDLLYTDGGIPFGEVGRSLVAHFYNENMKWHGGKLEAVYNIKNNIKDHGDYRDGVAVLDLERGVVDDIRPEPWQTDTSIGDWHYRRADKYQSCDQIIDMFVDIVSKNGNLLLNFPLKGDGTLDAYEEKVLGQMAQWIAVNGEGIYGTRPYRVFGEGGNRDAKPNSGHPGTSRSDNSKFTANDIRFTTKGNTLYAFILGWPGDGETVTITSLAEGKDPAKIREVSMLGSPEKIKWSQDGKGLQVTMPGKAPCEFACALKISRNP